MSSSQCPGDPEHVQSPVRRNINQDRRSLEKLFIVFVQKLTKIRICVLGNKTKMYHYNNVYFLDFLCKIIVSSHKVLIYRAATF